MKLGQQVDDHLARTTSTGCVQEVAWSMVSKPTFFAGLFVAGQSTLALALRRIP